VPCLFELPTALLEYLELLEWNLDHDLNIDHVSAYFKSIALLYAFTGSNRRTVKCLYALNPYFWRLLH